MLLNKDDFQIHCIELFVTLLPTCYILDLPKIDMNNQDLLQLRSKAVKERNDLQDAGGRKGRDELKPKRVSQLI